MYSGQGWVLHHVGDMCHSGGYTVDGLHLAYCQEATV